MPSLHTTDPATSASEITPPSEETPTAAEGIGSSKEVLALVNALKAATDNRCDDAQEKANQLARQLDAALRKSRERDDLTRQPAAATSATGDVDPRMAETEKALLSIRQARDTVLARNAALNESLTATENRVAELEYELEKAGRARDAALALSRDLSQTCDELRQGMLELTYERDHLQRAVNRFTEERATLHQNSPRQEEAAKIETVAQIRTAEPSNASDKHAGLSDLQACIQLLTIDAGNGAALGELDHHLHSFRQRAQADGCAALDRLSAACEVLTGWLRKAPNKIPATLGPLSEAVSVLSEIAAIDPPDRVTDPAGAFVFLVDDDVDNCECITMALEKMVLKARYAVRPEPALNELAAGPCDLIILDVGLPGMNGFDLFGLIRKISHHKNTPIIFLSGVEGGEERAAALPGNAHVFVPKPYNLNELGLIALRMILKARLAALD